MSSTSRLRGSVGDGEGVTGTSHLPDDFIFSDRRDKNLFVTLQNRKASHHALSIVFLNLRRPIVDDSTLLCGCLAEGV